jgi:hypothetical protein
MVQTIGSGYDASPPVTQGPRWGRSGVSIFWCKFPSHDGPCFIPSSDRGKCIRTGNFNPFFLVNHCLGIVLFLFSLDHTSLR